MNGYHLVYYLKTYFILEVPRETNINERIIKVVLLCLFGKHYALPFFLLIFLWWNIQPSDFVISWKKELIDMKRVISKNKD